MDTDSLYIAIAGNTLEGVMKPEILEKHMLLTEDNCQDDVEVEGDDDHHR